jgi:hypothetical protein
LLNAELRVRIPVCRITEGIKTAQNIIILLFKTGVWCKLKKSWFYLLPSFHNSVLIPFISVAFNWEHAVGLLVEAQHYKPEGGGFDSRWCHWNFSLA